MTKLQDPIERLSRISDARAAVSGGRIKDLRLRAHLSQSEIARAVDVAPATVSRWENAMRLPRGEKAVRLARVLRFLEQAVTR